MSVDCSQMLELLGHGKAAMIGSCLSVQGLRRAAALKPLTALAGMLRGEAPQCSWRNVDASR